MSDTPLLESVVTKPESDGDFTVTTISISGEPQAAAIVNAVAANYHRLSGRPRPTEEQLRSRIDTRVTLVYTAENVFGAGAIMAREGKLFQGQRGLAILPKGKRTKGYSVDVSKVLDFFDGHVTAHAHDVVMGVRDHYPTLVGLTRERLEQLPDHSEDDRAEILSLAVFGTYTTGWGETYDAIWLAGEYWREQDIVENVLLVRPDFGISEAGSCYGRQWLNSRAVGEVVGFEPITFSDGIRLCDVDYDEALEYLFGGAREVAQRA